MTTPAIGTTGIYRAETGDTKVSVTRVDEETGALDLQELEPFNGRTRAAAPHRRWFEAVDPKLFTATIAEAPKPTNTPKQGDSEPSKS